MEDDEEPELVRVYAWGAPWVEVYYGSPDWPSYSVREWWFPPWPLHMR